MDWGSGGVVVAFPDFTLAVLFVVCGEDDNPIVDNDKHGEPFHADYSRADDIGLTNIQDQARIRSTAAKIICPYSKVQCVGCGMCDGKDSKFRKNIAVNAHGVQYKVSRYKEYRTQLELPVV